MTKSFGKSHAFRYAIIAAVVSTAYVLFSLFVDRDLGAGFIRQFIIQLSPMLFGILGFVIGHKEDLYRSAVQRAETDFLTGLPNHSNFQNKLGLEIDRSARYQRPLSLLMLDLDHFKAINDQFGHQKGDDVLRLVGAFLREETRRVDYACRYGGEEFVVIMPEVNWEEAIMAAERLRAGIRNISAEAGLPERYISASFGVADFPSCSSDAGSLIYQADQALLSAKREGRDRVAVAHSRDPELVAG